MIEIRESDSRGFEDHGWLKTYHSFSFANYYDPENINFGPLRVLNYDIIQPGSGFPLHPHNDMEIITIILEGEIKHTDSFGNVEIIKTGDIQKMSAGSGIRHSEYNNSNKNVLKLLQIWIIPDKIEITPNYRTVTPFRKNMLNNLLLVGAKKTNSEQVFIQQDVKLFMSELRTSYSLRYNLKQTEGVYLYLIDGKLSVNNKILCTGDAAKVFDENEVSITAEQNSYFILFDVSLK